MLSISLEKHLRIGATGPMLCSHKKCILSGHGLVRSHLSNPLSNPIKLIARSY